MIRVEAPAKINLYLHVTGRRADGYHELDSLVAFAGIGDTITITPAPTITLTVGGPMAAGLPEDDGNIVVKAARRLAQAFKVNQGAAIHLEKRLPVASGIGGGSADAAATLTGLARLWDLNTPVPELALELGADVPVCLAGRPAHMGGIGETLSEAPPLPPAWLVLANPMRPLATPAVFKARTGPFSAPAPLERPPTDARDLAALLDRRANDLTAAALTLVPEIGEALDLLGRLPGCLLARMSGSGATCFALFAGRPEAEAGALNLAARRPGWWVAAAPLKP